jgi:hypothetical protein
MNREKHRLFQHCPQHALIIVALRIYGEGSSWVNVRTPNPPFSPYRHSHQNLGQLSTLYSVLVKLRWSYNTVL